MSEEKQQKHFDVFTRVEKLERDFLTQEHRREMTDNKIEEILNILKELSETLKGTFRDGGLIGDVRNHDEKIKAMAELEKRVQHLEDKKNIERGILIACSVLGPVLWHFIKKALPFVQ